MTSIYDFSVATPDGGRLDLADLRGDVVLIVNVASKCGLTKQYAGLEALYRDMGPRGLRIIGVPCNQFGGQEPGTDDEIQEFCSLTYDVTFPIVSKVDVNGPDADPLYVFLRAQDPGDFQPGRGDLYEWVSATNPDTIGTDEIKWNFTKFLIGRDGAVVRRYEPYVRPDEIQGDLEGMLSDGTVDIDT